jgi:hypothetical protein
VSVRIYLDEALFADIEFSQRHFLLNSRLWPCTRSLYH